MRKVLQSSLLALALLAITGSVSATQQRAARFFSTAYMLGTDMARPVLYLFDLDEDRMITVDLTKDPKWPGGAPLHTIVTPNGRKAYLSVIGSERDALNILALRIHGIDWTRGTADIRITKVIRVDDPGSLPRMRVPSQIDRRQPVTDVWRTRNQQLHGPSIHPSGKFVYFAQWTDEKIRVIDVARDQLAASDPIRFGDLTRQIHGVFLNPSGTMAIANGYYFDRDFVTLFRVDRESGNLRPEAAIELVVDDKRGQRAAWTHFVDWLDDRYAITATQQLGPTSLTPTGVTIVGPSVWLLDARKATARMIIGPAQSVDAAGIYKPASDIMVLGNKLYVAEEDTGDEEINESYISIFDFTDRTSPKFLKRLRPGRELPAGWSVSHEFYRTVDRRWLYAQSWHSGHMIKLDPRTDRVVRVWSKAQGFIMPHGNFIPGTLR